MVLMFLHLESFNSKARRFLTNREPFGHDEDPIEDRTFTMAIDSGRVAEPTQLSTASRLGDSADGRQVERAAQLSQSSSLLVSVELVLVP